MTRQLLNKLEVESDISHRVFHHAVRDFLTKAADYALSNLPVHDEIFKSAGCLNFEKREISSFSQVEYFVHR